MTPQLFWLSLTAMLTGLFFVPYILDRVLVRGLMGAMANPSPDAKPQSPWAERARLAHYNAVENLVVFATLVLAAHAAGVSNSMTLLGCQLFFWGRLAHYVVYTFGIPVVRTLSFVVAVVGELLIAIELIKAL